MRLEPIKLQQVKNHDYNKQMKLKAHKTIKTEKYFNWLYSGSNKDGKDNRKDKKEQGNL